jgi:hypothetical protein
VHTNVKQIAQYIVMPLAILAAILNFGRHIGFDKKISSSMKYVFGLQKSKAKIDCTGFCKKINKSTILEIAAILKT